jgi:hypothetical protein
MIYMDRWMSFNASLMPWIGKRLIIKDTSFFLGEISLIYTLEVYAIL